MRLSIPHRHVPYGWERQDKAAPSECHEPKGQCDRNRNSVESLHGLFLHDEPDTCVSRYQDNTQKMFQYDVATGNFVSQLFQAGDAIDAPARRDGVMLEM